MFAMQDATKSYVERTAGDGWRVAGSRVSLDSIVHAYWEGRMPESILADFPSLSLEQIHGAIAFYLSRREEIDAYLVSQDAKWDALRAESEARHGSLLKRLRGFAGKTRGDVR